MTPDQIYQLARNVGFPPDMAVKMTAVALRESGGNPTAYNGNSATGDNSYGLWQVNMYGALGQARLQQLRITDPAQLLDPVTNAQAAYTIWNGSDTNFNTAWGYKDYSQWMPEAVMAATGVEPGTGGVDPFNGGVTEAGLGGMDSTTLMVIGGLVLAFLVLKD
jgi:hypothetical protein